MVDRIPWYSVFAWEFSDGAIKLSLEPPMAKFDSLRFTFGMTERFTRM